MKCSILKKSNKKVWNKKINKLPKHLRSVFFKPEYLELYENKKETIRCFVFEEKEKIFLYPFLVCKIPKVKKFKDIKTAYGYGGPVSNSNDQDFLSKAIKNLRKKLYNENVIAELIKFNPFCLNKAIINNYDGNIFSDKIIIFINLKNNSENDIYDNYKKSCKKKLKKINCAEEIDIKIENNENALLKFKKIYDKSMVNLNADKTYFKDKKFYRKIYNNLRKNFIIFSLYLREEILTSQLLLFDNETVHCHMYGSTEYAKKKSLIVFSYHKLIMWAKKKGFNIINFGGGRTSDVNDTLLQFKQNFSNTFLRYHIGEKVLNKKVYDKLSLNKNEKKLFKYRN